MIESSRIDDGGHENDLPRLIEGVLDFDRNIGNVLHWAEQNGETLVIIVADHETGGLSLLDGDLQTGNLWVNFATEGHSGIMVPVYAYGPGSYLFSGIYENTAIFNKISSLLKPDQ